jgi:hypothetical protein
MKRSTLPYALTLLLSTSLLASVIPQYEIDSIDHMEITLANQAILQAEGFNSHQVSHWESGDQLVFSVEMPSSLPMIAHNRRRDSETFDAILLDSDRIMGVRAYELP